MDRSASLSRRDFVRQSALLAALAGPSALEAAQAPSAGPKPAGPAPPGAPAVPAPQPFLTPAAEFRDVSRGDPVPHTLKGEALTEARLTDETWRLEITADPFIELPHTGVPATLEKPRTLAAGDALDLAALIELGRKEEVHFLKGIQCLNIDVPLGQGLWTGVPLRSVLRLCGRMDNVRRIYFWGFHNHDPKQIFKSSVSYTQCMETPPGELPVFLAYKLNGEPIPLKRGGPVRMVVPWAHGFKSIKWLQHIFVTNDPRNQDTYSNGNNDPDSLLKSAAYLDESLKNRVFKSGDPVVLTGKAISGPSGIKRVETWVRPVNGKPADAAELERAPWTPCELDPQPQWQNVLPAGVRPESLLGFDKTTGQPLSWPLRYSIVSFSAVVRGLAPGKYEGLARTVDLNDFAQPEPRPAQKSGRNGLAVRAFEIT